MPPKKSEPVTAKVSSSGVSGNITNMSAGDIKIIMSVLRNSSLSGKPWLGGTVDWVHVAEELQLKSDKTARDRMHQVRIISFHLLCVAASASSIA